MVKKASRRPPPISKKRKVLEIVSSDTESVLVDEEVLRVQEVLDDHENYEAREVLNAQEDNENYEAQEEILNSEDPEIQEYLDDPVFTFRQYLEIFDSKLSDLSHYVSMLTFMTDFVMVFIFLCFTSVMVYNNKALC